MSIDLMGDVYYIQEFTWCRPIGYLCDNRMSFCAAQFRMYFHCVRELHPSLLSSEISTLWQQCQFLRAKTLIRKADCPVIYEWHLVPKVRPFSSTIPILHSPVTAH